MRRLHGLRERHRAEKVRKLNGSVWSCTSVTACVTLNWTGELWQYASVWKTKWPQGCVVTGLIRKPETLRLDLEGANAARRLRPQFFCGQVPRGGCRFVDRLKNFHRDVPLRAQAGMPVPLRIISTVACQHVHRPTAVVNRNALRSSGQACATFMAWRAGRCWREGWLGQGIWFRLRRR
jgi:hypothetical protein